MPDEPTTRRTGALDNREAGKRGYVYILINPAFAGFLKIGNTSKAPGSPDARTVRGHRGARALRCCLGQALVSDCDHVERMIHQQLAPTRSRRDREFFAVPLKRAIAVARDIAAPFACACEESLPPIINGSAVATILPDESTVEVPSTRQGLPTSRRPGEAAYPECRGARFLDKHADFCSALAEGILGFGQEIETSFDPMSIIFSDRPNGKRSFFGITPQLSQVLLAPLTLEITDIRDLQIPAAQIRDISDKKYKMGGLFRVEMDRDSKKWELALELARRSCGSTRTIETWNLLVQNQATFLGMTKCTSPSQP